MLCLDRHNVADVDCMDSDYFTQNSSPSSSTLRTLTSALVQFLKVNVNVDPPPTHPLHPLDHQILYQR